MKKSSYRPILIFLIVTFLLVFYLSGGQELLTFENLQRNLQQIQALHEESPFIITFLFMGVYVLITSLSIPGSIVLTILSGAIFGPVSGTFFVSISSCLGACMAFIMSRYLFKDYLKVKFKKQLVKMDQKLKRDGKTYLLLVRMVPVSPFVVINLVMGLTSMRLWTYAWITFVGMLPGTFVYVYAGRKFSELESLGGIMTWPIIFSLTAMGLLPILARRVITLIQRRRVAHA